MCHFGGRRYVAVAIKSDAPCLQGQGVSDPFCKVLLTPQASAGPRLCRRPFLHNRFFLVSVSICYFLSFLGLSKTHQKSDLFNDLPESENQKKPCGWAARGHCSHPLSLMMGIENETGPAQQDLVRIVSSQYVLGSGWAAHGEGGQACQQGTTTRASNKGREGDENRNFSSSVLLQVGSCCVKALADSKVPKQATAS